MAEQIGVAIEEPIARTRAKTMNELRDGLVATYKDSHWRCQKSFMQLCGLSIEQLQCGVKKWWGNQDLWLDMLATEIGINLGTRLNLGGALGARWSEAAASWLDATYARATDCMSCPPQRATLRTQTEAVAMRVMKHALEGEALTRVDAALPDQSMCGTCGKGYSRRLGQCPVCVPRRDSQKAAQEKRPSPEERQAQWRALPSAPLAGTAWDEALEAFWCHGGSGGVLLLRFPAGVICAKNCSPTELFAQRLASALGVRTAGVRVLSSGGAPSEQVSFREHVRRAAVSSGEEMHAMKIMRSRHLSVMEFVDGFSMMGMDAHKHLQELQRSGAASVWQDLGRLMALDMLINNFDRLPLAWGNDGNLGNVLLGSSLGPVVGIDQCVAPITHAEGLRKYTLRVREAVVEARDGEAKAFAAVKEAVYNNTAVELTAADFAGVRRGCLDLATEVAGLVDAGGMDRILDDVSKEVHETFASAGGDGAAGPATAPGIVPSVTQVVDSCNHLVREVARTLQETLAPSRPPPQGATQDERPVDAVAVS
mmetsp:Transcript_97029/g.274168  ORF Transcript_97029/g.274168 Transcript_97029/m.274168 type:complete len:539 (+) Transcript_97029:86-1702(+)